MIIVILWKSTLFSRKSLIIVTHVAPVEIQHVVEVMGVLLHKLALLHETHSVIIVDAWVISRKIVLRNNAMRCKHNCITCKTCWHNLVLTMACLGYYHCLLHLNINKKTELRVHQLIQIE